MRAIKPIFPIWYTPCHPRFPIYQWIPFFCRSRGFTTYTGRFNSTLVSIVATGMGTAMMDFLVRESRAVVKGPMAIVRLGSCGGLTSAAAPATVVLNSPGSRLRATRTRLRACSTVYAIVATDSEKPLTRVRRRRSSRIHSLG